jgi:hypothetical protein
MTYPDHLWPFATICDHFWWFSLSANVFNTSCAPLTHCDQDSAPHSTPTVQYTIAESIGMSGYKNSEAASAYRFGLTLVQWFRDITMVMKVCNRFYELDMVILKVGLLLEPLVLCTRGKIYQFSSFHFKISHYIYTPLYIQEKQVELHPASLRTSLWLGSRL